MSELGIPVDRETLLDLLRREAVYFQPTSRTRPPVRPVVYYVRWGDRIKIGFSRRLAERLKSLYHDEVLAVEPGSPELERRRHRQFSEYKIPGQREWFRDAPALRYHINTVRDQHITLVRGFIK